MKNLMVLGTVLLAPFALKATEKSGFYAGGKIGYVHSHVKGNGHVHDQLFNLNTPYTASPIANNVGFGFFGGYHHYLTSILLGLEVGVDYTAGEAKKTLTNVAGFDITNKLSRHFSSHVSFKLGGDLSDNITIYGKFGATVGRFKLTSVGFDNLNPSQKTGAASKSVTVWGVRPALGIDYCYSHNVAFSLEAAWEIYNKRIKRTYLNTSGGNNYDLSASVKPKYTTIMFGVSYKF